MAGLPSLRRRGVGVSPTGWFSIDRPSPRVPFHFASVLLAEELDRRSRRLRAAAVGGTEPLLGRRLPRHRQQCRGVDAATRRHRPQELALRRQCDRRRDGSDLVRVTSTCRRHQIDSVAYLQDIVERLAHDPAPSAEVLRAWLPDRWRPPAGAPPAGERG